VPRPRLRAAESQERGEQVVDVVGELRPATVPGTRQRLAEALLDQIGRRMTTRDELAADLVRAMRRTTPAAREEARPAAREDARDGIGEDGGRVTMAQFRTALEAGIDAVPPALSRFFAEVDRAPDWVDWDELERGARSVRRPGRTADDVLLQLSLIGGYRFGWAVPGVVAENLVRSGVIARTRVGRRYLERSGDRYREGRVRALFAGAEPRIGPLG
jgi:hypothetical protein